MSEPVNMEDKFVFAENFNGKSFLGRLIERVDPRCVRIDRASWVADTGRYSEFIATGKAAGMEIEVLPPALVLDVVWTNIVEWPHPLPTETV